MSHLERMTATLLQHARRLAAVWCGTLALALVAAIYIARVGSVGHGEVRVEASRRSRLFGHF